MQLTRAMFRLVLLSVAALVPFEGSAAGPRCGPENNSGLDPQVLRAIRASDVEGLNYAIRSGARVCGMSPEGRSALVEAIKSFDPHGAADITDSVRQDDQFSDDVNIHGERTEAQRFAEVDSDLNLEKPDAKKVVSIVETLLRAGADPDFNGKGAAAPLGLAVASKETRLVQLLLQYGARVATVTSYGTSALALAASYPHGETIVEELLKSGADPNDAGRGSPPLILAARNRNAAMVSLLLDRKADLDARSKDDRESALGAAVAAHAPDVVKLLLARGAPVEARDRKGQTPLFNAVHAHDAEMVWLLVQAGASVRVVDKAGISPLVYARYRGNKEVIAALEAGLER